MIYYNNGGGGFSYGSRWTYFLRAILVKTAETSAIRVS